MFIFSNEYCFYLNLVYGTCLLIVSITRYDFIRHVAMIVLGEKLGVWAVQQNQWCDVYL